MNAAPASIIEKGPGVTHWHAEFRVYRQRTDGTWALHDTRPYTHQTEASELASEIRGSAWRVVLVEVSEKVVSIHD